MDKGAANIMAHELMRIHLPQIGEHWTFRFDNAKRRFGCCNLATRVITLSLPLTEANDESHVRNTMLHEIAHALAGPGAGHGYKWKAKALALGIRPDRCYDSSEVVAPEHTVLGTCPNCGKTVKRFRRSNIACSLCCRRFNNGKYTLQYAFVWKRIV